MPNRVPTHRPFPAQQRDHAAYDRTRRNKESKSFYHSRAWIGVRDIKLCDHPYCELCLLSGKHAPAMVVHHIKEITMHPELALDMDNMQSLCKPCHSRVHALRNRVH